MNRWTTMALIATTLILSNPARAEAPPQSPPLLEQVMTPAPAPPASFAGEWQTTFGPMVLSQEGDRVRGTYELDGGRIDGAVTGDVLRFTYTENRAAGEGEFTLAPTGRSFEGKWRVRGTEEWRTWTGTKLVANDTFEGVWQTSFGPMRLVVTGAAAAGTYALGGGSTILGKIDDSRFEFTYEEPGGVVGVGWFELAPDGQSFNGRWAEGPAGTTPDKPWTGRRVVPQRGRAWLIILEAHWEGSISEHEYSYGRMLREYFQRIPAVQVRHRYFDGVDDLRRWCAELAYIPEPIVLYISTHGAPAGIMVNGATIGAKEVAEMLPQQSTIKLLHLGGCLMMAGDLPSDILRCLGDRATFPISGFTEAVDWGTSALVDFAYLTLLFEHDMTPRKAVDAMHRMISFSRDPSEGSTRRIGPLPPCGLRVVEPSSRTEVVASPAAGDD